MKDILLDENAELGVIDGDFAIGESLLQDQELLLISNKNDWKENPDMGVGIEGFLEDEDPQELYAHIREQFGKDNMRVSKITTIDGVIKVLT